MHYKKTMKGKGQIVLFFERFLVHIVIIGSIVYDMNTKFQVLHSRNDYMRRWTIIEGIHNTIS